MSRPLNNPIASRRLEMVGSPEKVIVIKIGRPTKQRHAPDWVCRFAIEGLGDDAPRDAFGVDGIQALIEALNGLRTTLEKSGGGYTWAGGEKGDHGIPRIVPLLFGKDFADRVGALIDAEFANFAMTAEDVGKKHSGTEKAATLPSRSRKSKHDPR